MLTKFRDVAISDKRISWPTTHAIDDSSLASSDRLDGWSKNLDLLLSWLAHPDVLLLYDEIDPVDPEIIQSAIDFAHDHWESNGPLPTTIGPSIDGHIAFEWQHDRGVDEVEIIGEGRAIFTRIIDGHVLGEFEVFRDPSNRGWKREK